MEGQTVVGTRKVIIAAGLGGFCAGALAGFLVARYLSRKEIDQRVAEEAEAVRDHYAARTHRNNPGETDREGSALGTRWASGDLGPDFPRLKPVLPRIEVSGLAGDKSNTGGPFSPGDPDTGDEDGTAGGGDLLEGMPGADPGAPEGWPAEEVEDSPTSDLLALEPETQVTRYTPYIITRTEFHDDTESDNQKITIMFYAGDKVLVDDKSMPIRNAGSVVGSDFAEHFGSPEDPDVVYVRNNRLRLDFEILRDDRGYSEVILGYGTPGGEQ
jgi:hypothetical protein